MKGALVRHIKVREDDIGNIIEVKMWRVNTSPDKPHGYKYSLVYIAKGKRVLGYDNAEGKGDHRHDGEKTEPYNFTTPRKLSKDFYRDVKKYKEGKS